MRIRRVRIHSDNRTVIHKQAHALEFGPYELLHIVLRHLLPASNSLANHRECVAAHLIHATTRLQMRFERVRCPSRLEMLDKIR
jgi:hypothetical protein